MVGEAAYRSPVRSPVRKPRRSYSASNLSPMRGKQEVYCASPVRELRSLCKERGLKVSGVKDEIVERLVCNDDDEIVIHTDAAEGLQKLQRRKYHPSDGTFVLWLAS